MTAIHDATHNESLDITMATRTDTQSPALPLPIAISTVAVASIDHVPAGAGGDAQLRAMTDGYRSAFTVAVGYALLGLLVAVVSSRGLGFRGITAALVADSSSGK